MADFERRVRKGCVLIKSSNQYHHNILNPLHLHKNSVKSLQNNIHVFRHCDHTTANQILLNRRENLFSPIPIVFSKPCDESEEDSLFHWTVSKTSMNGRFGVFYSSASGKYILFLLFNIINSMLN